jgi:predicted dehydrogenase
LQNALGAIKGGKHVLVEKPMTINARDAEILISAAKEKGVFLMEGAFNYFPAPLSLLNLTIGKIINCVFIQHSGHASTPSRPISKDCSTKNASSAPYAEFS